jgi:hypothetical protein
MPAMAANSGACPRCGAPRAAALDCPHCGVVYARAERRRAAAEPSPDSPLPPPAAGDQRPLPGRSAAAEFARGHTVAEARSELQLARFAVPAALLTSLVLAQTDMGSFLLRTFFGMWLHELGHAVAAWLCGYPAFPGPWFTSVGEERSFVFALAITAGLAYAIWRARTEGERVWMSVAIAVLVLQIALTVVLSPARAHVLITFCGDAGSMVFGAALMAAFFVPPGHKLHRDWLRWGFLVIGAASFADTFPGWWAARHDPGVIVFGEIEGRADTDPTVLVDSGWTVVQMVSRYVGIGVLSLAGLAAAQVLHVRRTRDALASLEADLTP